VQKRLSRYALSATFFCCCLRELWAFWSGSEALKADAFNSAGDAINTLVVLLGLSYALKPRDKSHHFGHEKMEALVFVGVVVDAATGYIVYETVSAIIAGDAGQLTGIGALTVYSESVVAILISGVIIKTAVSIVTESSRMLLDAAPDDETMQTMYRLAASAPSVKKQYPG